MSSFDRPDSSRTTADPIDPVSCPVCQSSSIKTTARRPNADSYWRCEQCGEVWNVGRRTSRPGGGHITWR